LAGVRLGEIRKLAKKIKTNHELAIALWETGNIDARLLTTLLTLRPNLDQSNGEPAGLNYFPLPGPLPFSRLR